MNAEGAIGQRIVRELDELRDHSLCRTLDHPAGINLSSNDYLGLAFDPRLRAKIAEAVMSTGRPVGATGSRLLSGNAQEWEELEAEFARFAGTEAALYFGSGYAANVGLLGAILRRGDVVFSDALNHASLIDGMRLSGAAKILYPHGDMAFLENALARHANGAGAMAIVTETVFSMEGDIAPLKRLLHLARKYRAEVILDEAHATGVLGPEGRGAAAAVGIERDILASVHTCGKAFASAGAFVCGGASLRNYLTNRARTFVFSTAMPPYLAAQIHSALKFARAAETERENLQEIAGMLRRGLAAAGVDCGKSSTHIVPVILGSQEAALFVAGELQRKGFAVKAIRPPTVAAGTSRIRLSLTSRVTRGEIGRLTDALVVAIDGAKQQATVAAAKSRPGLAPALCMAKQGTVHRPAQFFVTGTGTGIGKTLVSALLCAGLNAFYWKPIQTGYREGTDRRTVMRIGELTRERTLQETYIFSPPVSPHLAARRAGVRITLDKIKVPALARRHNLVVEGAGGALVPINEKQLMTDVMRHLKLPVVVVSRTALGTINHTLLTLEALRTARLDIRGVVMCGKPNAENRKAIERYGEIEVIGAVPALRKINRQILLRVFRGNFNHEAFRA